MLGSSALRLLSALLLLLSLGLGPRPAGALTFQFLGEFEVGAFGPDKGAAGTGTPRGIAVGDGVLLVNDALDDQIFETDTAGVLQRSFPTDPFCDVAVSPACISTGTEFARVGWDVTYHASRDEIWLVDRTTSDPTRLFQLSPDGLLLASGFSVAGLPLMPRALEVDPRTGELLITGFSLSGTSSLARFDISSGTPSHVSTVFLPTGINPEGLAHYAGDLFLLSDTANDDLYLYEIPLSGTPVLLGETSFTGIDASSIGDKNSVDYDPVADRLYVLDDTFDRVLVFSTVPEPGAGALLALGLAGLAAAGRARRKH